MRASSACGCGATANAPDRRRAAPVRRPVAVLPRDGVRQQHDAGPIPRPVRARPGPAAPGRRADPGVCQTPRPRARLRTCRRRAAARAAVGPLTTSSRHGSALRAGGDLNPWWGMARQWPHALRTAVRTRLPAHQRRNSPALPPARCSIARVGLLSTRFTSALRALSAANDLRLKGRSVTNEQLRQVFPELDLDGFWEGSAYADETSVAGIPLMNWSRRSRQSSGFGSQPRMWL